MAVINRGLIFIDLPRHRVVDKLQGAAIANAKYELMESLMVESTNWEHRPRNNIYRELGMVIDCPSPDCTDVIYLDSGYECDSCRLIIDTDLAVQAIKESGYIVPQNAIEESYWGDHWDLLDLIKQTTDVDELMGMI